MRHPTPIPSLESSQEVLDEGHLWIQELVPGPLLAFTMDESGLLTFAMESGELDDPPPSIRTAVDHVRESIDRERLRDGVDDVSQIVFSGFVTRNEGVEYHWSDLSPFLGVDIWTSQTDGFVTPDIAERVFDVIGLNPIPAFEKEIPASHFSPDRYEFPPSHWRDGDAWGVIIRNKSGGRGTLRNPDVSARAPHGQDLDGILDTVVQPTVDMVLSRCGTEPGAIDVDALSDSTFEHVARIAYHDIADKLEAEPMRVRSKVGVIVRSIVRNRVG